MNFNTRNYSLQTVPSGKDILEIESYTNRNKDCVQTLPALPDNLKSDLEIAHWLLVENFNNWAYLELDVSIDLPKWQEELKVIYDQFVPHPDQPNQLFYESCTMHGISSKHTMSYTAYTDDSSIKESDIDYIWTEIADQCPTITNFWKNEFPMGKWNRVRFQRIRSGGYIGVHRDMTLAQKDVWNILTMDFGVNMSITHPEGCETWFEGYGKVPWAPGKFFLHNVSKLHWVNNFTAHDRVHMIPMGLVGDRINDFCSLVTKSYLRQTGQIR